MMKGSTFALLGAFVLAVPSAGITADVGKMEAADRMVCTSTATTGTRFTKRVCMKQSEREKMARAAQDAMQEVINAPKINGYLAAGDKP